MLSRLVLGSAWCCVLTACGGGAAPPPATPEPSETPAPGEAPAAAERTGAASDDPRQLPGEARFGDLVVASDGLSRQQTPSGARGCLLGARGDGFYLGAELAASVRPLPEPPRELGAQLDADVPVRVVSRWGQQGPESGAPALAVFTATTPRAASAPATAVLVTSEGVYLRHTHEARSAGPLAVAELGAALDPRDEAAPVFYVSAERDVALARVHAALAALPARAEAALATVLAADTRIPAPREPEPLAAALRCGDGLPPPPDATAQGELTVHSIMAALAPLTERAQRCLARAGAHAARGGKVMMALRVDAEGVPEHVCIVDSALDDQALGSCLVRAARAVRFPTPEPSGYVDIHMPLSLRPVEAEPQSAVCPGR